MEYSREEAGDTDLLCHLYNIATDYVRQESKQFDSDVLLNFYSRYKQIKDDIVLRLASMTLRVSEGLCSAPKPGILDFQARRKWESWRQLGDMSSQEAMSQYVSLLGNLVPDWKDCRLQEGIAASYITDGVGCRSGEQDAFRCGFGVTVSTMRHDDGDVDISDDEKTVFHWCVEGNVDKVREMMTSDCRDVDCLVDSQGLGLLHWACDRGLVDMVTMLFSMGASVNLQDSRGQTALHYAVSCDHRDVVRLLMAHNADVTVADEDGCTPLDDASYDMKDLLTAGMSSGCVLAI